MNLELRIRRLERAVGAEERDGWTWEEIQEAYYAAFPEELQKDVPSQPALQRYIDHPPPARAAARWPRIVARYRAYCAAHGTEVTK